MPTVTSRSGRTRTSWSCAGCRRSALFDQAARAPRRRSSRPTASFTRFAGSSIALPRPVCDVQKIAARPVETLVERLVGARRRSRLGGAGVVGAVRDGGDRSELAALAAALRATPRAAAGRRVSPLERRAVRHSRRSGSSARSSPAAATSIASSAKATVSCGCRPAASCARSSPAGSASSRRSPRRGGQASVRYGDGAARFAGATYDPTSHYRAASVFAFHEQHGADAGTAAIDQSASGRRYSPRSLARSTSIRASRRSSRCLPSVARGSWRSARPARRRWSPRWRRARCSSTLAAMCCDLVQRPIFPMSSCAQRSRSLETSRERTRPEGVQQL